MINNNNTTICRNTKLFPISQKKNNNTTVCRNSKLVVISQKKNSTTVCRNSKIFVISQKKNNSTTVCRNSKLVVISQKKIAQLFVETQKYLFFLRRKIIAQLLFETQKYSLFLRTKIILGKGGKLFLTSSHFLRPLVLRSISRQNVFHSPKILLLSLKIPTELSATPSNSGNPSQLVRTAEGSVFTHCSVRF